MSGGERPRPAQALLVLACLAAVVVAAAAVPGVAGPTTGDDTGTGGSGTVTTTGGGDGGGGGVGVGEILRWLFGDGDADGSERTPPEYEVRVAPEPVPGRTVTVTVTRLGAPVEGARVAFGERPVGLTNASGQVRGEVPYGRDELVVRVRPPARAGAGPLGGAVAAPPAVVGGGALVRQAEPTPTNVTERYGLETTASVRVVGDADPGTTVRVVARVGGDPLPRATVRANGDRVGRTDANGTRAVRVPDDGSRRLRIGVERGAVSGERTVPVRLLAVQVRPADPIAVPGRPATVAARVGADPASNATVAVAGERVGRTDTAGHAPVTLPSDPTAEVVVRRGDRVARQSLLVAYTTTGVALAVPAAALLAAAVAVGRRRETVARRARRAGHRAVGLARRLARGVSAGARWLGRAVPAAARGLGRLAGALARQALRLGGRLAGVPRRVVAWASPRAALAALLAGPRWLLGLPGRLRPAEADERAAGAGTTGVDETVPDAPDLDALWVAFARAVVPDGWRHRTPAEVGRTAVERGLPAEPVERVTRAVRERAYAPDDLSADERDRVVETLRGLLSEAEDDP